MRVPERPRAPVVREVMGMAVGIDVRDDLPPEAAIDDAFAELLRADELFSTYRPDSEISRLAAGALGLERCSSEVREVLAHCEALHAHTGGYFDVRAGGSLDPSGLVKGWAVERAHGLLRGAGVRHSCINAAGDVRVGGGRPGGEPWRVGIRDPFRADHIHTVVALHDGAVATSGAYERGDHVLDPHTGGPARGLASATVVGPDLGLADAYATALFAMGPSGIDRLVLDDGYSALAILPDGSARTSPGFAGTAVS